MCSKLIVFHSISVGDSPRRHAPNKQKKIISRRVSRKWTISREKMSKFSTPRFKLFFYLRIFQIPSIHIIHFIHWLWCSSSTLENTTFLKILQSTSRLATNPWFSGQIEQWAHKLNNERLNDFHAFFLHHINNPTLGLVI